MTEMPKVTIYKTRKDNSPYLDYTERGYTDVSIIGDFKTLVDGDERLAQLKHIKKEMEEAENPKHSSITRYMMRKVLREKIDKELEQ